MRLAKARLATDAGVVACGSAFRLLLQGGLFVVVARMLGTADYGAFISITALVSIVSTFAGLSCEIVLVKQVSRDPTQLSVYFGRGLLMLALTTPVLVVVSVALVPLISGAQVPWYVIVVIAVSDLLFLRVNILCAACYQAIERIRNSAIINVGFSVFRLSAAVMATLTISKLGVENWAIFYAGGALVAATVSSMWVIYDLGPPKFRLAITDLHFGFHSSLQSMLYFGLRDIDKPLLSRWAGLPIAGLYAAAFRLADAAIVPIRALMYAAYARYFRHGQYGVRRSSAFALRILPFGIAYGVFAAGTMEGISYFVPVLLGAQYAGSAQLLRILAALPCLHACYVIGGDALTASNHQPTRTAVQAGAAILMVALCMMLIPRYGAIGAALANISCHAVMAGCMWVAVAFHRYLARRVPASAA